MTKVDKVLRKFKLRNGLVIEEATESNYPRVGIKSKGGYQDEYIVLPSKPAWEGRRQIVLQVNKSGFPTGGAHGEDFDIVEELLQSAQLLSSRKSAEITE